MALTESHITNYHEEGYTVVHDFFPESELEQMRSVCSEAVGEMDRRIDRGDPSVPNINHKGSRYFIPHIHRDNKSLREIIFSDKMAELCRRTMRDNVYLFLDQYVVKAAEHGMEFSWHQDAGFVPAQPGGEIKPYLTCWIPLDDVTEDNGTVYILPFSRAGTRELVEHWRKPGSNDMVGYDGNDLGVALEVPAGTLTAFTSHTLHRSGPNTTDRMRRVYLIQYSPELITNKDGSPRQHETPFLRDGVIVASA